ncbi:MAG: PHP domain-containing protein [Gemmatimonadales bacterium]
MNATVDLHVHSTASDGELAPAEVVARASAAGLAAMALTDHDTIAGVPEARAAGERLGVRVVAGCEFSVAAPWGEMHLLGYLLPEHDPQLEAFLAVCRADRERRVGEMVDRLAGQGVRIGVDDVRAESRGGAMGRPHVARALVRLGHARGIQEGFDRWIGRGRVAYVEKRLPTLADVSRRVHQAGGLVSAAHLKDRGTRAVLKRLKAEGLDAVETRHPSHAGDTRANLTEHAEHLGLLRTGGSDWHGGEVDTTHGTIGSEQVPLEWLTALDAERARRVPA